MTPDGTEIQRRNVELVRNMIELMNREGARGVGERLGDFWHPEMEWSPGMLTFGRKTYRGHDEYRQYMEEAAESSFLSHATAEKAAETLDA